MTNRLDPKYGVVASPSVSSRVEPVHQGGGTYRVAALCGGGRTYVPEGMLRYGEGMASWYGMISMGGLTANGEVFDMQGISSCPPTLQMPCYVRVTNPASPIPQRARPMTAGPITATV